MFLLDTNVVSEMRKYGAGRADANVVAWVRSVAETSFYISAIIVQEIQIGILRLEHRGDDVQAAILRRWLEDQLLTGFADRILPVDVTVARRSARLHVPDARPYRDGLIAATAIVNGMTLVTRNEADFANTGLAIVNPWTFH